MTNSGTTPDHTDVNERLEPLESRLAFLEHTVDVLSSEVQAQQRETRMLTSQLEGLREKLESLQHDAGSDHPQDEPPPHY
jgi:SlyX protein